MRRNVSLTMRLAILVAGTALPLILFAGGLIYQHYLSDQKVAFDRVLQFTRGLKLVLEREMQGIVSGLTVLASSPALQQGDFNEFRTIANAFLAGFPGHPSIVIADASGQIVFDSKTPPGSPLPQRTLRADRDRVFRTGQPAFSPMFVGSVSKRPIVTVTVPVFRDNKVVYDLSFDPPQEVFQHIIEQQQMTDDWTISIFDQNGVNFARVPNPEQTVGKRASPTLFAVMFSAPEGEARTVSLEGVPLLTAFVRSELSGWVAASGIAENTLTAPLKRSVGFAAALGVVMLAIGLAFAVRMATQIARAETLHSLLIDELNHRVKNTLATVQSLASQTFRNSTDTEARSKFSARLGALGRTHDTLSAQKWDGANIDEVIDATLAPFQTANVDRIRSSGPSMRLSPRAVVVLSMAIHELATNAVKYGALSTPAGRIRIDWHKNDQGGKTTVSLCWQESGGPPVTPPERTGFGSTLIEQGFAAQLNGKAELDFASDGVKCTLEFSTS